MEAHKIDLSLNWVTIITNEDEFTLVNESPDALQICYSTAQPTDQSPAIILKPKEGWLSAYGTGVIWAKTVGVDHSAITIIK